MKNKFQYWIKKRNAKFMNNAWVKGLITEENCILSPELKDEEGNQYKLENSKPVRK